MKKGADFVIRDYTANDIFTLDDLSEEQRMMADAATEFVDREIMPVKPRFEQHDYDLVLE